MAKPLNCSVQFEGLLMRILFGFEFNFKVSFTCLISFWQFTCLISVWRFYVVEQAALAQSVNDSTMDCLSFEMWSDRKLKYGLLLVGFR